MVENKLNLRSTACSMHCSASRAGGDSFYLNGKLPGAYLADNTQTEATPTLHQGVFAVFSDLHPLDKSKVSIIDEFKTSIINSGNVAVNAFIENFNDSVKQNTNYSFAMVKIKNDVAQIYYKGDCDVYIYRGGKVILLNDRRINEKEEKDTEKDSNAVSFTPEFKFIENDALIICTKGVKEKLSNKVLAHILSNTQTSKAAAQSITLSANENHCISDATAIVIRAFENTEAVKDTVEDTQDKQQETNQTQEETSSDTRVFEIPPKSEKDSLYPLFEDEDDSEDFDEKDALPLGKAAWAVIGILAAALGVIAGLITLMYI